MLSNLLDLPKVLCEIIIEYSICSKCRTSTCTALENFVCKCGKATYKCMTICYWCRLCVDCGTKATKYNGMQGGRNICDNCYFNRDKKLLLKKKYQLQQQKLQIQKKNRFQYVDPFMIMCRIGYKYTYEMSKLEEEVINLKKEVVKLYEEVTCLLEGKPIWLPLLKAKIKELERLVSN